MIRKDISNSDRFAALSPKAAVLFCMLIPHLNSHGKMNGGIGYVKDEICPFVPYLSSKSMPVLLREISEKTNVKWFEFEDRYWIHSLNFNAQHQNIRRLGIDRLPGYSGTSPGVVQDKSKNTPTEVEGKGEVEQQRKGKGNGETPNGSPPIPHPGEAFVQVWNLYPKKRGRKAAERHFRNSVKTLQDLSDIKKALEKYKKTETYRKGYIQNGSTWFNNWQDDLDYTEPGQQKAQERTQAHNRSQEAEDAKRKQEAAAAEARERAFDDDIEHIRQLPQDERDRLRAAAEARVGTPKMLNAAARQLGVQIEMVNIFREERDHAPAQAR